MTATVILCANKFDFYSIAHTVFVYLLEETEGGERGGIACHQITKIIFTFRSLIMAECNGYKAILRKIV